MRLVLHIGMAKTGTTTLQAEMAAQHRQLARHGICYPVVQGSTSHSGLNCLIRPFDRVPRQFRGRRRADETSMRSFGESFWEGICRAVRKTRPAVTVLSSEHFFNLRDSELARLEQLLRSQFSDIQVVAYVRPPANYYVAVHQQRVKASYRVVPPGSYRMRLRRCLERYQSVFDSRLVVHAYERSALIGDDIVIDFSSRVFPPGSELRRGRGSVDKNESMSAEGMCVLQRFRYRRFPEDNDVFNPETRRVMLALANVHELIPQTPPMLRPELASLVTANHRDDLDWLADEFDVVFESTQRVEGASEDVPAARSDDLAELLEVSTSSVDATVYALLEQLAR